jgi:predicted HD phosphohydrolase
MTRGELRELPEGLAGLPYGGEPVDQHAEAKRHLVTTDSSYRDLLSPASVSSMEDQGGAMTPAEVEAFAAHPWAQDALRLRRWDDAAKAPGAPAPTLDDLLAIYERASR